MNKFNILNLKPNTHIHFVGIGGVSMSGLAQILLNLGYKISGSDLRMSKTTERLLEKGIKVFKGHAASNVVGADVVVFTAAVKPDNPEIIEAKNNGLHIVERSTLLGQIMKKYKYSIGISGTHGKTTTTSMLSMIFIDGEFDPTITIGGDLDYIGGNLKLGNSEYFITEACEYVESFLKFYPFAGIILNIDEDHLDYYKDINHITSSFEKFARLIPHEGYFIANADDENINKFIDTITCTKITFAIDTQNATYYAKNVEFDSKGCSIFDVIYDNNTLGKIKLNVPGMHNILNALAAIATALTFGIEFNVCQKALKKFKGAKRRFEYKGEFKNVTVIDDYAHHPTEIQATLSGAKKYPHKKLWCIFQPHTFSRTKALLEEFSQSFDNADRIILADIYAAREKNTGEIHSKDLVNKLIERDLDVKYLGDFDSIYKYVLENVQDGDVIITMGAGDIYKVGERLVENK